MSILSHDLIALAATSRLGDDWFDTTDPTSHPHDFLAIEVRGNQITATIETIKQVSMATAAMLCDDLGGDDIVFDHCNHTKALAMKIIKNTNPPQISSPLL